MKVQKVKNLRGEKWKPIRTPNATLKCDYFISNHGRVKSVLKKSGAENLLNLSKINKYKAINIKTADKTTFRAYLHKIMAEMWVKKKSRFHKYVNHKDGDRDNNKASNLEWVTEKEHYKIVASRRDYVWTPKGKKQVKLTEGKVRQIKRMLRSGKKTKKYMSEKFGVSSTQIKRIERGENWANVTID